MLIRAHPKIMSCNMVVLVNASVSRTGFCDFIFTFEFNQLCFFNRFGVLTSLAA